MRFYVTFDIWRGEVFPCVYIMPGSGLGCFDLSMNEPAQIYHNLLAMSFDDLPNIESSFKRVVEDALEKRQLSKLKFEISVADIDSVVDLFGVVIYNIIDSRLSSYFHVWMKSIMYSNCWEVLSSLLDDGYTVKLCGMPSIASVTDNMVLFKLIRANEIVAHRCISLNASWDDVLRYFTTVKEQNNTLYSRFLEEFDEYDAAQKLEVVKELLTRITVPYCDK